MRTSQSQMTNNHTAFIFRFTLEKGRMNIKVRESRMEEISDGEQYVAYMELQWQFYIFKIIRQNVRA